MGKSHEESVEFPLGKEQLYRRAYGRNGVGRHGMLCFANKYSVETTREGTCSKFVVEATSGEEPFMLKHGQTYEGVGNGTILRAVVEKNLPNADEIREIISARFLHNPEFNVFVNGKTIEFINHKGLIEQTILQVNEHVKLEIFVFDSLKSAKTQKQHGIAFWVEDRLVGSPSWIVSETSLADGRSSFAKRHTIVVTSEDLKNEVLPDWSAFKKTELMQDVNKCATSTISYQGHA